MIYQAAAAISIFISLGAGSAAMAADQEREDVQREILVTPLVGKEATTGALKEQMPRERSVSGPHDPRRTDKVEREEGVPLWLRWPSLTDF